MEPSQVPSVPLYRGSSTGPKPKIPKGHTSEVRVEARGEGSSCESSTEDENDGENPAQQMTPINASFVHLHLDDQLILLLLHGSSETWPTQKCLRRDSVKQRDRK